MIYGLFPFGSRCVYTVVIFVLNVDLSYTVRLQGPFIVGIFMKYSSFSIWSGAILIDGFASKASYLFHSNNFFKLQHHENIWPVWFRHQDCSFLEYVNTQYIEFSDAKNEVFVFLEISIFFQRFRCTFLWKFGAQFIYKSLKSEDNFDKTTQVYRFKRAVFDVQFDHGTAVVISIVSAAKIGTDADKFRFFL